MKFKSKTEAYSFCILILSELLDSLKKDPTTLSRHDVIEESIEHIKIAMENHEQNPLLIVGILEHVKQDQHPWVLKAIDTLQHDLKKNNYRQTPQEKFENPLARRLESEFALTLLKNPTAAMMNSVGRISAELIKFMHDQAINWTKEWAPAFQENYHVISLGAFKKTPTLLDIETILEKNDPAQLIEIMHLHFKFAAGFTRVKPITKAPIRTPVGKLADIIAKGYAGELTSFYKHGIALEGPPGNDCRTLLVKKIYESDLFLARGNRGRSPFSEPLKHFSNQLGLMLIHQQEEEDGLPTHDSSWLADCKNQEANFESQYVIDLIENDAVYVSGPSGMTSILLGQMETMVNFECEALKKNYLPAIIAYIVGGGFHSLHEVIGPAEHILNLIPGYRVQVPEPGHLAPPPNYHVFFKQQTLLDPQFKALREIAWQNYLKYFKEDYCHRHIKRVDPTLLSAPLNSNAPELSGFFKPLIESPPDTQPIKATTSVETNNPSR